MKGIKQLVDKAVLTSAKLLLLFPFFIYVLIVNGAIPGYFSPTLGQSVWLTGFAKSLADAPTFSLYAHTIGIPEPAAIAFGLPGAVLIVMGLKLGLTPPDSYALASFFWLAVAFWGAYRLSRHFGSTALLGASGAAVWLTFPIVWEHTGYSMLSIGIALLPTYFYSALVFLEGKKISDGLLFLFLSIVSSFMDGYTFVMFASATLALIAYRIVMLRDFSARSLWVIFYIISSFAFSYYLYSLYSPSAEFRHSIDFFRGWGVDIAFLLRPARGILWLPDLIGLSEARNPQRYFGDTSVYRTTFAVVPFALAVLLLLLPYGDRRFKLCLFAIGVITIYLALGPSFKFNAIRPEGLSPVMPPQYALGPTGTAVLWENVPGLYSMRAVYRWMALAFLAFWVVAMVAMADRRMPRWMSAAFLMMLAAINLPNFERILRQNTSARSGFLQMESDLAGVLAPHFRQGETVAFLPAGNDFLVNFLAPRLGVRTYNIGGDKNYDVARANWPANVLAASQAREPEDFAFNVYDVLSGSADMVAVPYINLLLASHAWPYRRDRFEEMQPRIQALRAMGIFEIVDTEYFALVRLNERIAAMPVQERRERLAAKTCPAASGRWRVRLSDGTALAFSQPGNLCGEGWSGVEEWGRWTDGGHARLHFDLIVPASRQVLEFQLRSYVSGEPPRQNVRLIVNGEPQPDWVFTRETARQVARVEIPDEATEVDIEFEFPDARSPRQAGASGDPRMLGIGVTAVCLTDADRACLTR